MTNVDENKHECGVTLPEVLLAVAIIGIVFNGVILAYIKAAYRAEWTGYSLAAQSLNIQQLEQARSGVWDNSINKNELTNLNLSGWTYNATTGAGSGYAPAILDLPISGTNTTWATNYLTLKMLYLNNQTNPPVQVQMITVDTVWPLSQYGQVRYFTNRSATYYGPDNRDASSL